MLDGLNGLTIYGSYGEGEVRYLELPSLFQLTNCSYTVLNLVAIQYAFSFHNSRFYDAKDREDKYV